MPVGELLQHAANHGVHHRGEVSLLLRLLGYAPENFDLLLYYAEKRRVQAPSSKPMINRSIVLSQSAMSDPGTLRAGRDTRPGCSRGSHAFRRGKTAHGSLGKRLDKAASFAFVRYWKRGGEALPGIYPFSVQTVVVIYGAQG